MPEHDHDVAEYQTPSRSLRQPLRVSGRGPARRRSSGSCSGGERGPAMDAWPRDPAVPGTAACCCWTSPSNATIEHSERCAHWRGLLLEFPGCALVISARSLDSSTASPQSSPSKAVLARRAYPGGYRRYEEDRSAAWATCGSARPHRIGSESWPAGRALRDAAEADRSLRWRTDALRAAAILTPGQAVCARRCAALRTFQPCRRGEP